VVLLNVLFLLLVILDQIQFLVQLHQQVVAEVEEVQTELKLVDQVVVAEEILALPVIPLL
jgi:hypothetical protein